MTILERLTELRRHTHTTSRSVVYPGGRVHHCACGAARVGNGPWVLSRHRSKGTLRHKGQQLMHILETRIARQVAR